MIFINSKLKISTFGGTHEKEVGALIDGFPIDFNVDMESLQAMLDRRKPGGELVSQRKEDDVPNITSGIANSRTTGDMIRVVFENKDIDSKDDNDNLPRPGHGDFTYYFNTGKFDKGATSARSTVGIVFAGAMCKQFLAEKGIFVNAKLESPSDDEIKKAALEGDSIGGIVSCSVLGLPVGFGSPYAEKIESKIASCIFNIPGVKGLEFGLGFELAKMRGSEANDQFTTDNYKIRTNTNNCGGLLGGMATGSELYFNVAFKPTPSIAIEQDTVNVVTGQKEKIKSLGKNDPCIAKRGSVVVEAAAAIALTDIVLCLAY